MTDRADLLLIARTAAATLLTVCTLAENDDLDLVRRLAHEVVDDTFDETLARLRP